MKEIRMYRTYSYGGMEGMDLETRTFETIELAKVDAKNDTWNSDFTLYEVILTFNGVITETENFIEKILCGRDIETIERETINIEKAKARIEEHKKNKRIKEATREKRIAEENEYIAWAEKRIERIKNKG